MSLRARLRKLERRIERREREPSVNRRELMKDPNFRLAVVREYEEWRAKVAARWALTEARDAQTGMVDVDRYNEIRDQYITRLDRTTGERLRRTLADAASADDRRIRD